MILVNRSAYKPAFAGFHFGKIVISTGAVMFIGLALWMGLSLSAHAAPAVAFDPPQNVAAPALFSSRETPAGVAAIQRDKQVVRWREVGVDTDQLIRSADLSPDGERILLLNLFDDTQFVAVADEVDRIAGGVKWVGSLRGVDLSQVIISIKGEKVFGSISMPGKRYGIHFVGNGVHELQEIDTSRFSSNHTFNNFSNTSAENTQLQGPGQYYTAKDVTLPDGTLLQQVVINGPPQPPPGFEVERQAVSLPEPDIAAAVNTLTVPAFNWVFGCSAVSASMIAGYQDRSGWPNIYTGPTNGGVMPLDNSSWPTWVDSSSTSYPSCPLIASKSGVDGRSSLGSIDDYWVSYGSTMADPYIGHWTQHTWGDAIGDYMKTSQSAFGNTDGATSFWNYTNSATALSCDTMASSNLADGTLGRRLFYQAKGYTVTDCYNQYTDNKITGGFSFAQFKAEINAGNPVMLNLQGHTIVGVGYDDSSNLVYLHDTWDYNNHTMTWGTSYSGMNLLSVSIVHLSGGGSVAATMSSPTPGTTLSGTSVTFSWTTGSGGVDQYWLDVGTSAGQGNLSAGSTTLISKTVSGLPCDASKVYVRLWTHVSSGWLTPYDYTYTAASGCSAPVAAEMQSPAPGSTLTGTSVTFSWTTGSGGVDQYWLDVGTSAGSGGISAGATTSTSKTVSGLPCDGSKVYVRLWTHVSSGWLTPKDYTYTAGSGCGTPTILTPTPGTTLPGTSVTFTWGTVSGGQYWLLAGTQPGWGDYYGGSTTSSSAAVTTLPCDGRTVYVQLWTSVSGSWQTPQRYTYTAASGCAALSSPTNNSTFSSNTITFNWNAISGADQYWLDVGNRTASGDISAGSTTATSAQVTNVPCDGRPLYVQLWTHKNGVWQNPGRYNYTAWGVCGQLTTPAPYSTLWNNTVTFSWNAGTGVAQYWLYVGTSPGAYRHLYWKYRHSPVADSNRDSSKWEHCLRAALVSDQRSLVLQQLHLHRVSLDICS